MDGVEEDDETKDGVITDTLHGEMVILTDLMDGAMDMLCCSFAMDQPDEIL